MASACVTSTGCPSRPTVSDTASRRGFGRFCWAEPKGLEPFNPCL
jgi:hypothetical protein